jgi:hypothetical protein
MDAFRQCVEDLETIGRLLELPHGKDIAVEIFRELTPYLQELGTLHRRDPTGAVKCVLDHAEWLRAQLGGPESSTQKRPRSSPAQRVA